MSKDTKFLTRQATVRDTTEEMVKKRQAEFVISSEAIDSYNTVFKIDGWDLSSYNRNPIVAYQHSTYSDDPDNIIGTSTIRFEDKKMIAVVTFEDAATNPKAEKIMNKVYNNTLRMASVGFNPLEYRYGDKANGEDPAVLYFTKIELREWSIVANGANPEALKRNQKNLALIRQEAGNTNIIDKNQDIKIKRSAFEAQILINKNK